jgi:hypothetical protein
LPALGRELEDRHLLPVPTEGPNARVPIPNFGNDSSDAHSNGLFTLSVGIIRTHSEPGETNNSGLDDAQVGKSAVEPELMRHGSKGTYPSTTFSELSNTNTVRLVTQESITLLGVPNQDHEVPSRQPGSPALLAATHAATDRFTRRFPISVSHRKANSGAPEDDRLLSLLGYGETGAVVEWPNVWTPEKWALLLSVCSVSQG